MGFIEKFQKIRDDRMGVVTSSVYPGIKRLVSQIYPDEAHFIYELLQNAEDTKATEVVFKIMNDMLIFEHNGKKQFDDADIDAITNIGDSTKKDNYVQAGKFGIGFKSVYAFTETPYIYCDSINFKIEKLLLPTIIEALDYKKKGWTVFHFPFDSPKISSENAKRKIKQGLLEIENTTLLFLNNICTITYILEDGSEYQVKKNVNGNMISVRVYNKEIQKTEGIWKKFSRIAVLHGKKIMVDLAFSMESIKDKSFNFILEEGKVCITFLAKNEKSNLKFYINAPFGCTPSRDTVNKEDEDNKILIRELAQLAMDAIEELKEEKLLTDDFFNILPIADDEISEFYMPIVESICNTFKKKNCLPTINNEYVTVSNGIMSSRNVIDKVVTIKDVQILFGNDCIEFVKNRPLNSRAYKFLKQLDIEELTPLSILMRLVNIRGEILENWLINLENKQLIELYSYLYKAILDLEKDYNKYERYEDYIDYPMVEYYKEEYEFSLIFKQVSEQLKKIKSLKIVKTEKGKFYKSSDVRMLLQEIKVPKDYKLVDRTLLARKESLEFLKIIGVIEFTEKELEKYLYSQEKEQFIKKVNEVSLKDNALDVARMILEFFEKHKEDEVNFGDKKYVWTNKLGSKNERKNVLATPRECYLDLPYIKENGFRFAESVHKKKALSDVYMKMNGNERTKWIEFLKRQGIYYTLEIKQKSYNTGYLTGYHTDYTVELLQQYVSLKNCVLNKFIWSFFVNSDNWEYWYAFERRKLNRNYSSSQEDSSILKILKSSNWILDNLGDLRVPKKVSENNIARDWIINRENGFLDALDFGAEQKKVDNEVKKQEEIERLQKEQKKEAAILLGFDTAEDVIIAKESIRMITELKEMGIDIQQLYNSKKKEKTIKKNSLAEQLQNMRENEFNVNTVCDNEGVYGVQNLEHRNQELKQSMSEKEKLEKKIVITKKSTINQEEKYFVGTEYFGKCQICSKIIYKKDGSRHFVAMNLLDTGHLEEKYLTGLSTGWNTLCLCPNCAAEFKYGAVSLFDFEEKVKSTQILSDYHNFYEFNIQMQGEDRILHYTPKHLLSLKYSLEYFEENKDIDSKDNYEIKESNIFNIKNDNVLKEIVVLKMGDKCPQCNKSNSKKNRFNILDKSGNEQLIEGRVCSCGTKYLTHKEWKKLDIEVSIKVVDGYIPIQKKLEKNKNVKIQLTNKCPKCGMTNNLFANTGMCWSCYKEEMTSRYE